MLSYFLLLLITVILANTHVASKPLALWHAPPLLACATMPSCITKVPVVLYGPSFCVMVAVPDALARATTSDV